MAGSAAADTRYRYYNRRFERALPGMDLLLDAFAVVDCGMAQAIAHRGQKPACGAGCYHCCTQPIPLTPLEILGLRIFMGPELVSGHAAAPALRHEQQGMAPASGSGTGSVTGGASACMSAATDHVLGLAADVRQALAARLAAFGGETARLGATCPFLHEGRCAVYPVRPMACRRYIVYGAPCARGRIPPALARIRCCNPVRIFCKPPCGIPCPGIVGVTPCQRSLLPTKRRPFFAV